MALRSATSLLALLLGTTMGASAQSPADRPLLDSLLTQLGATTVVADLPTPAPCTARSPALGSLCDAMISIRRAEFTGIKGDASHARDLLDDLVGKQPNWPVAWYALAVARLCADQVGLSPDQGPLQHDKADDAAGAERALLHALTLDSTFALAAQALALAPVVHDTTSRLSARVTALRRARRLIPPPVMFAVAMVEREAGHLDSAVAIELSLLKNHAVPRGLLDITIARDLFHARNDSTAMSVYFAGATDTAAVSRYAYRRDLDWIASAPEMTEWDSLAAAKRPDWLKRFWAVRDLRDGRPPGARIVEHYQRLEEVFAMYRFRRPPKLYNDTLRFAGDVAYFTTEIPGVHQPFHSIGSFDDILDDRGLAYMRQGLPYLAMRTRDGTGLELWQYKRAGEQLFLSFNAGLLPQRVMDMTPWHGIVLKTMNDTSGFVAPAMLVPTVAVSRPAVYGGYDQADFCALKSSLCKAFPDSSMFTSPKVNCTPAVERPNISWRLDDPRFVSREKYVSPESLAAILRTRTDTAPADAPYIHEREREEGWWTIDHVNGADAFPIPFYREVNGSFDAHVLRHTDGTTRLVVAFSIPAKYLPAPEADASRDSLAYPIHVHIAALRTSDQTRIDLDTIARVRAPVAIVRTKPLNALFEMPIPAGTYSANVWLLQLQDSSGVQVGLDTIAVAAPGPTLHVSDLILGLGDGPVRWNSGEGNVPLNPDGEYSRGGAVQVYFQVAGLVSGKAYETHFDFVRDAANGTERPLLTITSSDTARTDRMAIQRTIGLNMLQPGNYRLRVTVSGQSMSAVSTGCLTITK